MGDEIDEEYLATLPPKDQVTVRLLERLWDRGPHVVARFFDELFDNIAATHGEEKAEEALRDFEAMMIEARRKGSLN